MNAPDDGDLGEQHTLKLITEYSRMVAANEMTAATAAKALLAAAVPLGLQGASRSNVCTWLRMVADELERGGRSDRPS
jgi:hypothetical protein